MNDVTLLFGIGATKAGSTWLYQHLSNHPECHFRRLKELHYFNCAEAGSFAWRTSALTNKITRLERRLESAEPHRRPGIAGELADVREWLAVFAKGDADQQAYLAYLDKGRMGQKLVGDITPAYAMLNADSYAAMARLTPKVRFIYILRDPLERLWSNIRMAAKRSVQRLDGDMDTAAHATMEQYLAGDHAGMDGRSDYAGAIRTLTSVVPREHLHLSFFETLFSKDSADKITDFLGISRRPARFDKVVHAGTSLKIDPEQKARALVRLRPQYEFVTDYFQGAVPGEWNVSLAEV